MKDLEVLIGMAQARGIPFPEALVARSPVVRSSTSRRAVSGAARARAARGARSGH